MKTMLLKFIEKTGKRSEFELFLKLFRGIPRMKFAVIKISGKSIENNLNLITEDIAFLNKLDIYPILVHGGGSVLDKKLVASKKINCIRVTSEQDMEIIKEVFRDISAKIKEKIIANCGNAETVEDVFECEPITEYGYVGRIKSINISRIKEVLDKNCTPIISPLGKYNGTYLNINADTASKELVKAISPKKFILITETGGILDRDNQIIPFINLSSENELEHVTGGMLIKVQEIKEFLKDEQDCAVVITSEDNLLKEIFTIKGSGTFIKYHPINSTTDIHMLDKTRLKGLLEDAFGKKLVDGYFDNGIKEVFYQKDYEGVAIIKRVNNIPYLDKFAVARFRQGTALGKSLWCRIIKSYPKLIWRADPHNPFNRFYTKNCDGMIKYDEWNVYWRNLDDDEILPAVQTVLAKKKMMVEITGKDGIPALSSAYLMNTYQKKIYLDKGIGCYVYDGDGNKYLDLIGGIATCSISHGNQEIVDTISEQAKKMLNASNLFYSMPQIMLAKKLAELSGMSKCFFSNSGTEAVEAAIKLARKHTGKTKIIAMKGCFHGRTMGSLSATWEDKYKQKFEPLVPGFEHVTYGDIEELKTKIDKNTAAVILEPIQGEGGIIIPPAGFLKEAESLCKEKNVLLIVDEVQSGNGRTGKYFCFEHEGISPDIVIVAKGISNGIPLGATLSKEGIDFEPGEHGSTFGGNSLSCAAALKTIEIIERLMPEVKTNGEYFMSRLCSISSDRIKEVRGKGMMIGIELNQKAEPIVDECTKRGLLLNCVQDKVLRFLPPLTITKEELDIAIGILEPVLCSEGDNCD